MKSVVLLGLVATLACGRTDGPPAPKWDSTGEPGGWKRRVVGKEQCLDFMRDRRCNPWYRPGDPAVGRVYLLLADDGSACVVTAEMAVMAQYDELFECRWRRWRG